MKKKISLGNKNGYNLLIIIITSLFCIVLVTTAIGKPTHRAILNIIELIVVYGIALLSTAFIQGFTWYVELGEDMLTIKAPFRIIQKYNTQELNIRYIVKNHWFRGVSNLEPCLVVGRGTPNVCCIERKGLKHVYDNYCLITLSDTKKLKAILDWFNARVELPAEEIFQNWCEQWKGKHVVASFNRIEKYYYFIETYNKQLRD